MDIKRYEKDLDYSYALGVYPTIDLFKYRANQVSRVILSSKAGSNSGVSEIIAACKQSSLPIEVNDKAIDKISDKENTYCIGVFEKYQTQLSVEKPHVVLVNPSNTGNLGTILRTMHGFEFKDIAIIKPGVDIFNPKTIRASMGSVFAMNYTYFDSIQEYFDQFPKEPYFFATDGKTILENVKPHRTFTLIFGNESTGLSDELVGDGKTVRIPFSSEIDSLNLSISVGIALYHLFPHRFI